MHVRTAVELDEDIRRLRHLAAQIDAVQKDFFPVGSPLTAPSELTQFHLRREMITLERQVREAVRKAFGETSERFQEIQHFGFFGTSSRSFTDNLIVLDRLIFDLEQQRLRVLGEQPSATPGLDRLTDIYTKDLFLRYLEHEVAWSHRTGVPFGLLLIRVPHWMTLKRLYPTPTTDHVLISLACVLKCVLRNYDLASRLTEAEFAVLMRDAGALTGHDVGTRIATGFHDAVKSLLSEKGSALELAAAVYPYDAETIPALFNAAMHRWTSVETSSPS